MNLKAAPFMGLIGICLTVSLHAAPVNGFLIVPGRSIGQTRLGPNGAAELKRLPPPMASDNGMMQTRLVWTSRTAGSTDTLFIHGVRNGALDNVKPADGTTLDIIRITSPQFHTQNGISTRSTLAEVRERFPHARHDHFHPQLYADAGRGIAFEFAYPLSTASRCIAVSVFRPAATAEQIPPTQSQIISLLKASPASAQ